MREQRFLERSRQLEDRRRWDKLSSLAASEDIGGFYRAYADYLEWLGVISKRRRVLLKMAKLVAPVENTESEGE